MIQDKNQRRNRQVMSPLNPIRSLLGVIPRETYSPVKNYILMILLLIAKRVIASLQLKLDICQQRWSCVTRYPSYWTRILERCINLVKTVISYKVTTVLKHITTEMATAGTVLCSGDLEFILIICVTSTQFWTEASS